MADRIGTLNEAVAYLSDKMSAPRVQVVADYRPTNQRRNLYMKSFPAAPSMSGSGMSLGLTSMGGPAAQAGIPLPMVAGVGGNSLARVADRAALEFAAHRRDIASWLMTVRYGELETQGHLVWEDEALALIRDTAD